MNEKQALIDHPIHEFLAECWSPYAFEDRSVSQSDLCSLFEAARWSTSSYNEQPWSYIVATKENSDQFQQLLSCLVEGNQLWAKDAPVLALGIVSLKCNLAHIWTVKDEKIVRLEVYLDTDVMNAALV
jgi:nitroreductase